MRQVSHQTPQPTEPPQGRDPAPSRLSYRMQRWMLTPSIRLAARVGVPFVLVFALTSVFLASEDRRDALNLFVAEIRSSIQERPEFMVGLMAIDGASDSVAEDIREVVPVDFPVSSFDLDLPAIRAVIVGLDPVREATVRIRPGGVMEVQVVERIPAVVWRDYDGVSVLDHTGAHVAELPSRQSRADLPLILGEGANLAVREALTILAAAQPLAERIRGLSRIGARRWDLVLDRGQRILLPHDAPVRAMQRVVALDQVEFLLARDVAVVDMRIGDRPTLRMTEHAVAEWQRAKQIRTGGQ